MKVFVRSTKFRLFTTGAITTDGAEYSKNEPDVKYDNGSTSDVEVIGIMSGIGPLTDGSQSDAIGIYVSHSQH